MTWVQVACSQLLSKPRWRKPTSTSQASTVSPSSLRWNLMVPWVAGWDGPICSSMVSSGSSGLSAFILWSERAALVFAESFFKSHELVQGALIDKGSLDFALGNPGLAEIDWIILAQRISLKFFVEQDST